MGNACSPQFAAQDVAAHPEITKKSAKHPSRRASSIKSSVNHQNGDSAASTLVGSSLRSLRETSGDDPVVAIVTAVALSGASSFDPCPPVEPRRTIRASRPSPHTAALSRDAFHEDDVCEDGAQESSDATAVTRVVEDAFGAMPPTEEEDSAGHARSPSSTHSWGWSGCGGQTRRRDTLNDNTTSSQEFGPKSATQSLDAAETTSGSATNPPPGARPQPPSSQRGSLSGSDARSLMFSRIGTLRDVSLSVVNSVAHLQEQETRNTNPKKQTMDSRCASERTISSERAAEQSHERSDKEMRKPCCKPAETTSATVSSVLTSGSSLGRLPALPAKDAHVVPPLAPVPSGTGSLRRSFRRTPLKKIDATAFKSVTFMSSDNSPLTPPIRSFGVLLQPTPRPGTSSISSRGLLLPPPLAATSPKPPVPVAWRISPSSPRAIRGEPLVRVAQAAEFGAMFFSAQAANTDATTTTDENADSITGEPALTHTQEYCAGDILALSADAECCHQQQPLPPIDDAADGPSVSSSYPLRGSSALLSASFLPSVVLVMEGELMEHQCMESDEYDEAPITLNTLPVPSLPAEVVANMDDEVCEHKRSVDAMIAIQSLVAETTLPFLGESHRASTSLF